MCCLFLCLHVCTNEVIIYVLLGSLVVMSVQSMISELNYECLLVKR